MPTFPHPFLYVILYISAWLAGVSAVFAVVLGLLRRSDSVTYKKDWIRLGIMFGVGLIVVTGGAFGPYGLLPVLFCVAFVGWTELLRCIEARYGAVPGFWLYPILGALGIAGSLSGTAYGAFFGVGASTWAAIALPMLITRRPVPMPIMLSAAFGMVFICVPLTHLMLLVARDYGAFAFLIVLVNVHDGFAVGFGRLLGRTPLCPNISPKKTWEGALGALAICIAVGYAIRFLMPEQPIWEILMGSALIAVFSVLGDLVASSLKREARIKDFGRALGATGGMLDRFDSLLFAAPIFYAFHCLVTGG